MEAVFSALAARNMESVLLRDHVNTDIFTVRGDAVVVSGLLVSSLSLYCCLSRSPAMFTLSLLSPLSLSSFPFRPPSATTLHPTPPLPSFNPQFKASASGTVETVDMSLETCTCSHWSNTRVECSHIGAMRVLNMRLALDIGAVAGGGGFLEAAKQACGAARSANVPEPVVDEAEFIAAQRALSGMLRTLAANWKRKKLLIDSKNVIASELESLVAVLRQVRRWH